MGEAGLFQDERVELLDGEVVTLSPQSARHAAGVRRARRTLERTLGSNWEVSPQLPIVLDERSEPEPDVAICRRRVDDYAEAHPAPADIVLVVEVAESSLGYDRGRKARAYARAGIPAYWIANLVDDILELLTEPDPTTGTYLRHETKTRTEQVTLPGGAVVAVADLLPPKTA